MPDSRDNDAAAASLGWFLVGAIAGAATALLLAPQSGRQTRERLASRSSDLLRKAQDAAGDTQWRAGDLFERGREYFEEQTQRLASAFEAGRAAMRQEMDRGRADA